MLILYISVLVCSVVCGQETSFQKTTPFSEILAASEENSLPPTELTSYINFSTTTASYRNPICYKNFGRCVNDSKDCQYDSAAVEGICEESFQFCCVPNQQTKEEWKNHDGECEVLFGNCQLDWQKCVGELEKASCGGPAIRKCCSPSKEEQKKWEAGDLSCRNYLGKCQNTKLNCSGNFQSEACGGPQNRQCCLPSKEEINNWEKQDGDCWQRWGTCQSNMNDCNGGKYEENLCGGPNERQCCVPGEDIIKTWPSHDESCLSIYGACQHQESFCNGTSTSDLCSGPAYRVCCSPDDSVRKSWENHDDACISVGGICKNLLVVSCGGKHTSYDACGGPSERKCCIVDKKNVDNTNESHPNESSHTKSRIAYSTKIALLITASLILIVILIAIIVAVSKKKISKSYKRVRDEMWMDRNGNDETVKLTSSDEKGTYA